mmetsp:Transcript_18477/g.42117  ORF Transcript_18477/g.42117 Transcript_18477/m.42117 type:complete len:98 (-) Transcript_18477:328-621(-)
MAFDPESQAYATLRTFRTRPTEKTLLEICQKFVASRSRRAAGEAEKEAEEASSDATTDDKPAEVREQLAESKLTVQQIDPQLLDSLEKMMRERREEN